MLTRREVAWLAAGSILLSVAMFWPLVLHLGTEMPKDLGDPLSQTWQLAWGGHALLHQPLEFFDSNQFYPVDRTLALSDALVGYAPVGVVGDGVHAAVARYGAIFLLASALAFAGPYLLARELGVGPGAAAVAGAAYAYSPWRLEQGGHLHILSSGAIAVAVFLLLRGAHRREPWTMFAGWVAFAWQVSIGFSLGLPLLVGVGAGGAVAAGSWWRTGRPSLPRRLVVANVGGAATLALVTVALAVPYLEVRSDEPGAERSPRTVATYSVGPQQFAVSSALNPIWGPASKPLRDDLPAIPEQTLFPGLTALLLAILGATWPTWPTRVRRTLLAATATSAVLSLGFETSGLGAALPYRWLYELVPGWSGIRVPERLHTFTTLGLALLAAAGAQRLTRTRRWVPALAVLAILVEGAGFAPGRWYPHPKAPAAPAGLAALPAPLLQLPAAAADNRRYLLWSTDGLKPMVNGRSSIEPQATRRILAEVRGFPDAPSVAALRRLGVRTVVLHTERLLGTPWAQWRARPMAGLGVTVGVVGRLAVFRIT